MDRPAHVETKTSTLCKKNLLVLFACLFTVMVGYGVTLTVLPFYIERMALAEGANEKWISIHVGLLTGLFAFMQFLFAPLWGRLSDRFGRRPLFIIGLGGSALTNIFFGAGTNMVMLYGARVAGGILSAAVLPAATAYVSDVTPEPQRGRGIAWLGSASGLGIVAGPALGAWLARLELHIEYRFGRFHIDGFSLPFFAAAFLSFLALVSAINWLEEATPGAAMSPRLLRPDRALKQKVRSLLTRRSFQRILYLSFLCQFAMALFEGTFALHGQRVMKFGPSEMGMVFMTCGLTMALVQAAAVGWLMDRFGEGLLLTAGFAMMGGGLLLLMETQFLAFILAFTSMYGIGLAMLIPTLATLASKEAGPQAGTALGLQNAVNSLGQALGPVIGGLLLDWSIHLPYVLTALPLIVSAVFVGREKWSTGRGRGLTS